MGLANARRSLDAVQDGHGDIDHKDIWIKLENGLYGFLPIPCSSYDVKLFAQLLAKIRADVFTVIGKQYPDCGHESPLMGHAAPVGASLS